GVLADAAAAGAGEVAGVQRLEHEHQREARHAPQLVAGDVPGHRRGQGERKTHGSLLAASGAFCSPRSCVLWLPGSSWEPATATLCLADVMTRRDGLVRPGTRSARQSLASLRSQAEPGNEERRGAERPDSVHLPPLACW